MSSHSGSAILDLFDDYRSHDQKINFLCEVGNIFISSHFTIKWQENEWLTFQNLTCWMKLAYFVRLIQYNYDAAITIIHQKKLSLIKEVFILKHGHIQLNTNLHGIFIFFSSIQFSQKIFEILCLEKTQEQLLTTFHCYQNIYKS